MGIERDAELPDALPGGDDHRSDHDSHTVGSALPGRQLARRGEGCCAGRGKERGTLEQSRYRIHIGSLRMRTAPFLDPRQTMRPLRAHMTEK
jgi:hypothetical protein